MEKHRICETEIGWFTNLIEKFKNFYCNPNNPIQLTESHSKILLECISRLESVLTKELENKIYLEVDTSGILNYPELLENGISNLFSKKQVVKKLPRIIKNDLNEAIRTLACNAPTASVMVSLRAVEAALRELCKKLTGKECRSGWKNTLDKVERELKKRNLESKNLEGYLDHFRIVRNEADHPERVFNKNEAEKILVNSVYAIEEIYNITQRI